MKPWQVVAFNPAKQSANRIHDDAVARAHGFRAGLVPGAILFAYLTHPAVTTWGGEWLDRGHGRILLQAPFYEGEPVTVAPKREDDRSYACELRSSSGEVRATGTAALPDVPATPPQRRDDRTVGPPDTRPTATREALEELRLKGMGAVRVAWRGEPPYDRYTEYVDDMPADIRPDQRALANGAFVLNLANRALEANVRLGPWIHVESELQSFGRLHLGRTVWLESSVLDLFERGGHEFCDLAVNGFLKDGQPIVSVRHRVIYKLRPR